MPATPKTFEAHYAFATSTHAEKLGRSREGAHYVARCRRLVTGELLMSPVIASGPFDTKEQAETEANVLRCSLKYDHKKRLAELWGVDQE